MRQVTNKATGEVYTYTEQEYIEARDRLIQNWQDAQKTLERAKEVEMNLRKEVVDFTFDPTKTSGTETIELGNDYKLKAVKKVTYGFREDGEGKIDRKGIELALSRIENNSPAGAYIAEHLVKWNPSLSLTEYKKLDDKDKAAIDAVIVTKEGAPTLELVEPKAKK